MYSTKSSKRKTTSTYLVNLKHNAKKSVNTQQMEKEMAAQKT